MKEVIIKKNDAGQRLDKFLTKAFDLPQSLLYKSIRTKKIKRNRKRTEASVILEEGDTLQLFLAPSFFGEEAREHPLGDIRVNLSILYEDENILLVNKPAGVSVHEDEDTKNNTLIVHIQAYLFQKGEYRPEEEQSFAPALCNRIDRNTSGIVICAKTAEALRIMNEKIKERELDKFYLCVVHGIPKEKSAMLTGYLLKDEKTKQVRIFDKNPPRGAKEIRTKYQMIAKKGNLALLEVELLTGRTHQIRAHLSHIGHPLLGDGKYGQNREDRHKGYKYQALCSYRLRFSFRTDAGVLSYLNGREFSIPKNEIYFTEEFFREKE